MGIWSRSFSFFDDANRYHIGNLTRQSGDAERKLLHVLRRESANAIIKEDIFIFEKLYLELIDYELKMECSDILAVKKENADIINKISNIEDFDLIGMRHFVKYEDSLGDCSEAIRQYGIISRYLITDRIINFRKKRIYENAEIKVFKNYVELYKKNQMKRDLQQAMVCFQKTEKVLKKIQTLQSERRLSVNRHLYDEIERLRRNYDDEKFWVHENSAENNGVKYGIYVKSSDKHGVCYKTYLSGEREFLTYYCTDLIFSKESEVLL